MRRLFLLLALAVTVAACQGVTQEAAFKPVAYTCASAAFALETAADLRAKMSAQTQATITRAAGVLNPVCSQPTPPTLTSTALAALSSALGEITAAVATAQAAP